jgi:hypothetical protein
MPPKTKTRKSDKTRKSENIKLVSEPNKDHNTKKLDQTEFMFGVIFPKENEKENENENKWYTLEKENAFEYNKTYLIVANNDENKYLSKEYIENRDENHMNKIHTVFNKSIDPVNKKTVGEKTLNRLIQEIKNLPKVINYNILCSIIDDLFEKVKTKQNYDRTAHKPPYSALIDVLNDYKNKKKTIPNKHPVTSVDNIPSLVFSNLDEFDKRVYTFQMSFSDCLKKIMDNNQPIKQDDAFQFKELYMIKVKCDEPAKYCGKKNVDDVFYEYYSKRYIGKKQLYKMINQLMYIFSNVNYSFKSDTSGSNNNAEVGNRLITGDRSFLREFDGWSSYSHHTGFTSNAIKGRKDGKKGGFSKTRKRKNLHRYSL